MSEQQHLWEVRHPYYCSAGAYDDDYESWDQFLDEWADADMDYNLLFRWDWYTDDGDELRLSFVQQRKGVLSTITVKVEKDNEPRIVEWLRLRFEYALRLWLPLANLDSHKS